MNYLEQFKQHLLTQKKAASFQTIKNYLQDIATLNAWYERTLQVKFEPQSVTPQIIDLYFEEQKKRLSCSTLTRHRYSFLKYFNFLKEAQLISESPLKLANNQTQTSTLRNEIESLSSIRDYKNNLYEQSLKHQTIKNYSMDVLQFTNWLKTVTPSSESTKNTGLLSSVNETVLEEYKQRLLTDAKLSPVSINRKLSSLRSYFSWATKQGITRLIPVSQNVKYREYLLETDDIEKKLLNNDNDILQGSIQTAELSINKKTKLADYSKFPPFRLLQKIVYGFRSLLIGFDTFLIIPIARAIERLEYSKWKHAGKPVFVASDTKRFHTPNFTKEFYAPLSLSFSQLPIIKRLYLYIRHKRPKWYKEYHSYTIARYLHFATLGIIMVILEFSLYSKFIKNPSDTNPALAQTQISPRILSFRGTLKDALGNQLAGQQTIRFIVYNNESATGSALLWQEVDAINTDSNGDFSTNLGTKTPLPQNIFMNNSVWLGVSIGTNSELIPRQQLTNVSLAGNAKSVSGLLPITTANAGVNNVLLALDSSSNLTIGGNASPIFQATGGSLTVSGEILTAATNPGSNGNIELNPDGSGIIDVQKPLQNTTNNNNPSGITGAVEIDDIAAILASSSAQSALNINQNGTGNILSASSSGIAKFSLDSEGNTFTAGNSGIGIKTPIAPVHIGTNVTGISQALLLLSGSSTSLAGSAFGISNVAALSPVTNGNAYGIYSSPIIATNNNTGLQISALFADAASMTKTGTGTINIATGITTTIPLIGQFNSAIAIPSSGGFGGFPQTGNFALYSANNANSVFMGNVGIGTNNPSSKLQIAGDITPDTDSSRNLGMSGLRWNSLQVNTVLATGPVGIGTTTPGFKLDVLDSQSATVSAMIANSNNGSTASGLAIKLGFTGLAATTNYFESFLNGNGTVLGEINGSIAGNSVSFSSNGNDFAEYFKKANQSEVFETGDLVCISALGGVTKCDQANQQILGVISDQAGFVGGTNHQGDVSFVLVGLIGQLPVNVSSEEPIAISDPLTVSPKPQAWGTAAKATKPGYIIGRVLALQGETLQRKSRVMISLSPGWYDPDVTMTAAGDVVIARNQTPDGSVSQPVPFVLKDPFGNVINSVEAVGSGIFANIQTGFLTANQVVTNSLQTQSIQSPVAEIDRVKTDFISPLASDSAIAIRMGKDVIEIVNKNASDAASVVRIDNTGNATFSGQLASSSLNISNDATVSGTLRVKKIIADEIAGLPPAATASAQYITSVQPISLPQDLVVYGLSTFSEASVANQLTVGQPIGGVIVANNTINVLGGDLELQPLRQGAVSILGDLVRIDTNGNITALGNAAFAKNVDIQGRLHANIVSPLPNNDFTVQLDDQQASNSAQPNSNFVIKNASNSAVFGINQIGDIISSGSATIKKLNIDLAAPAFALSQNEVSATGSAGIATISAAQTQLTIDNPNVTDRSLIYITPKADTNNQVMYLLRQVPHVSFSVGIPNPPAQDIPFNWIIVN